jgi:hypothetical protein
MTCEVSVFAKGIESAAYEYFDFPAKVGWLPCSPSLFLISEY